MSDNREHWENTDCHTSDVGHWFAMTESDFAGRLKLHAEKPREAFSGLFESLEELVNLFPDNHMRSARKLIHLVDIVFY